VAARQSEGSIVRPLRSFVGCERIHPLLVREHPPLLTCAVLVPVSGWLDLLTVNDKVAGVRASTAGADSPTFTTVPVGCELRLFTPVSSADVVELVKKLPDKQCTSDPLPIGLHGY